MDRYIQYESKNFIPWGLLKFFSKQLRIFNQNSACLLYVHIYSKWLNFIQLSLNLTELCHIKHNHPVSFHFSLYRLHRKGWMATKFTWISCVGCNASGISLTSLKARDHSGAKKCTAADLGLLLLSASLYFSKRGAYWDRLCRDVVGRWLVGWLSRAALWPNGAS